MKRIIVALVLLLASASSAHADACSNDLTGFFKPEQATVLCSRLPAKLLNVAIGSSTGVRDVTFASGGYQPKFPAASVITPSTSFPTPSAGNTLSNRTTILAAGAPTAAYVALPVITANVGKSYTVYSQGSNPLAIVPQTGAVNVSAALTPFSCTTLKECKCTGLTTGVWGCSQQ